MAGSQDTSTGTRPRRGVTLPWRLIAGLGLVVVSVVGVTGVVVSLDRAEPYLVATSDIVPGDTVDASVFETVWLHVRDHEVPYLTPDDLAARGHQVALRLIPAGELVPRSALGVARREDVTTVTIPLVNGGARFIQPGYRVDVWVSAPRENTSFSVPHIVAPGALLLAIRQEEGFAVDPNSRFLDVEVSFRDTPELIHALANGYAIHVTPAGLGPEGSP